MANDFVADPRQGNLHQDNLHQEKLRQVRENIEQCAQAAGRNRDEIQLIAVSKTRSLDEVQSVAALQQQHFAENTIQDAMSKIPQLNNTALQWHFIGHLQSKKAGKIPGYFQWVHSIDSLKLAQKLSNAMQSQSENARLNCLIQINTSAETGKSGLKHDALKPFLQQILDLQLPCLEWRGLMTIGVRGNEQQTRHCFAQLRALQQSCQEEFSLPAFDQLSMGMSDDYCLAIEEGATLIRVGSSIFGQRKKRL